MGKFAQFMGSTACLTASGIGYGYWERQQRLAARRTELESERVALTKTLESAERALKEQEHTQKAEVAKLKARGQILDNFWGERSSRFAEARRVNESHLTELPFTLKVLTGLKNHYAHAANTFPQFFSFDQGASKLHDFALLNSVIQQHVKSKKGDVVPPPAAPEVTQSVDGNKEDSSNNNSNADNNDSSTSPAASPEGRLVPFSAALYQMANMFHAEPIVDTVCMNLRLNEMMRESPKTLEELSLTFEMAEYNLRSTLKEINGTRQRALEAKDAAKAGAKDQLAEVNDEGQRHSNLVHRSARKVIGALYLQDEDFDEGNDGGVASNTQSVPTSSSPLSMLPMPWRKISPQQKTKTEADEEAERVKKMDAAISAGGSLKTQGVYLHSSKDVAAAIEHVDELLTAVDKHKFIQSAEEQEQVTVPVQALLGWQRAASNFLIQEQGADVLKAFHICLEYSFLNKNAGVAPELSLD